MRQIPLGARGSFNHLLQPEHLANRFKDAILPPVFATPVLIMVMENAAPQCNQAYLDPGESAVGTAVNVRHLAATPVGRLVTGEAEMTKADGRQIEFTVRATEGAKEIGAGSHSRVVIDVAKFTRRLGVSSVSPDFDGSSLLMRARLEGFEWVHDLDRRQQLKSRPAASELWQLPYRYGPAVPVTMTTLWVFRSCVLLPRRLRSSHRFRGSPPGRGGFGRSLGLRTRRGRCGWVTISDDPPENMQRFVCYPERYPNGILATYSNLATRPNVLIRLATPAGMQPATTSLEG